MENEFENRKEVGSHCVRSEENKEDLLKYSIETTTNTIFDQRESGEGSCVFGEEPNYDFLRQYAILTL